MIASAQRDTYYWRRSIGWGQALLAVGVVAVLLCLMLANVLRASWTEAEDGVLWVERPEGLVAAEVSTDSAGAAAGVMSGDLLLAVDGIPISNATDFLQEILIATEDKSVLLLTRFGGIQKHIALRW